MSDYSIQKYLNPILIALVGALGAAVGLLVWTSLQDIKTAQTTAAHTLWDNVQTVARANADLNNAMTGLATTLKDHIQVETQIDQDFKVEQLDHEQRIRGLERPSKGG